jgi:hypothetical protein
VKREQISRVDFPPSGPGYDRPSVDAHLEAVAAFVAALEAQVKALEVERDALRTNLETESAEPEPAPAAEPDPEPEPERELEPEPDLEPEAEGAAGQSEPAPTVKEDDEVSARLVATRLALEGTEREQIRQKLEANYELEDTDSLIDDVLERLA